MTHYDYLIVGSGLFGAVFAHEMKKTGKSCLVLERRDHVGGNVYCEDWLVMKTDMERVFGPQPQTKTE